MGEPASPSCATGDAGHARLFRAAAWVLGLLLISCGVAQAWSLEPVPSQEPAPLELPDLSGTKRSLVEYRGKVVLVNFWGTWCAPCLAEMPSMEAMYQDLAGQPFTILAVSVRDKQADIERYLGHLGVTFPVLIDAWGQSRRDWSAKVVPASYLIDTRGRLRYQAFGALDWQDADVRGIIESLIAESPPTEQARR